MCGSCGADKTSVFLRLFAKMSDRFLEQRINTKFRVQSGKNKKLMGEKVWKIQVFLSGINGSKRVKVVAQDLTEPMKMLKNLRASGAFRCLSIRAMCVQLKFWQRNSSMCRKRPELRPNDWILHHDNAPAHKTLSVKQFLAQKIHYWNGTPTLFPWFGSEWLLAI
jgi:hypothetical protein